MLKHGLKVTQSLKVVQFDFLDSDFLLVPMAKNCIMLRYSISKYHNLETCRAFRNAKFSKQI